MRHDDDITNKIRLGGTQKKKNIHTNSFFWFNVGIEQTFLNVWIHALKIFPFGCCKFFWLFSKTTISSSSSGASVSLFWIVEPRRAFWTTTTSSSASTSLQLFKKYLHIQYVAVAQPIAQNTTVREDLGLTTSDGSDHGISGKLHLPFCLLSHHIHCKKYLGHLRIWISNLFKKKHI